MDTNGSIGELSKLARLPFVRETFRLPSTLGNLRLEAERLGHQTVDPPALANHLSVSIRADRSHTSSLFASVDDKRFTKSEPVQTDQSQLQWNHHESASQVGTAIQLDLGQTGPLVEWERGPGTASCLFEPDVHVDARSSG